MSKANAEIFGEIMSCFKMVFLITFATASLGAIWDEPVIRHVPFDPMEDADLIEAQERENAHSCKEPACVEELPLYYPHG